MKISLRPQLNYPFPDLINPNAERAEELVRTWIERDYLAMPESYHEKKNLISI